MRTLPFCILVYWGHPRSCRRADDATSLGPRGRRRWAAGAVGRPTDPPTAAASGRGGGGDGSR